MTTTKIRQAAANRWLIVAATLSMLASLVHVACIFGGGDWYRYFGAGEQIARLDEAGSWTPAIMTAVIAVVLAGWALYSLSGAGLIRRVPLLRTGLVAITAVLLLRAAAYFVPSAWDPAITQSFKGWSSLIVFALGMVFAIGTIEAWPKLAERRV